MAKAIITFGPNGPYDIQVEMDGIENVSPKKIMFSQSILMRTFKQTVGRIRHEEMKKESEKVAKKEVEDKERAQREADELSRRSLMTEEELAKLDKKATSA
jgi:hypothetical protein